MTGEKARAACPARSGETRPRRRGARAHLPRMTPGVAEIGRGMPLVREGTVTQRADGAVLPYREAGCPRDGQ